MNKREFVAGGVAAVVAAPSRGRPSKGGGDRPSSGGLLSRTHRLPDLVERPGAAAFEAYVGERFTVIRGAGVGEQLVVAAVERVARCGATEQFNVAFAPVATSDASAAADGVRLLMHATGQCIALHLERRSGGYDARFNLLTPGS